MHIAALFVLAVSCSAVLADIRGSNPAAGTCLCFSGNRVRVRSAPCGSTVLGSVNAGRCFKSKGSKQTCYLDGTRYEFFRFDYGGRDGWAAGNFMNAASASSCGSSPVASSAAVTDVYTCSLTNEGGRVHEATRPTQHDCRDNSCGNTCQGGQCVAYVTCSCKKNGKWAPRTACWRPGTKVRLSNGKCNRNIPRNTAIATFNSSNRYYAGHAAVFIECKDDYTVKVYDQGCCEPIGYSNYPSSHSFFKDFAVITNPGICSDRTSWPCRFENGGSTCCSVSVRGCSSRKYYY